MLLSQEEKNQNFEFLTKMMHDRYSKEEGADDLIDAMRIFLEQRNISKKNYSQDKFEKLISLSVEILKKEKKFNSSKVIDIMTLIKVLVDADYTNLEGRDALLETVYGFLQDRKISLDYYSGDEYLKILTLGIKALKEGNKFNLLKASQILVIIWTKFQEIEKNEKDLYTKSIRNSGIKRQLLENGFLKPYNEILDSDIEQIFKDNMPDSVYYTTPLKLHEGSFFIQKLQQIKNSDKKLLMPINIGGNHWVLVNAYKKDATINIECWDPTYLNDTQEQAVKITSIKEMLEQTAIQAFKQTKDDEQKLTVNVSYQLAGEQNDGYSCGYRIVRKALQAAGVENELTKAPTNNVSAIYTNFVKLLAKNDSDLKNKALDVIGEGSPFIYLQSHKNKPEIKEVIRNKKESQMRADENLAIVLQNIYRRYKDTDLPSEKAFNLAQEELRYVTTDELRDTKKEVIGWINDYYKNKQCSAPFKYSDLNVTREGIELKELTPSETPLIKVK